MQTVDVIVWTVMQGDEEGSGLVGLNISRELAEITFHQQAREIEAPSGKETEIGGLRADAGCDWVEMKPRTMTVPVADLLGLLRQPALDLIDRHEATQ
jgi:hypothetical protein